MTHSSGPGKIYLPAMYVAQTRKPQRVRTLDASQGTTKRQPTGQGTGGEDGE